MQEISELKKRELSDLSIEYFNKVKGQVPFIDIEENELEYIKKLSLYAAIVGKEEDRMKKDNGGLEYRFFSGFIGEYAISKLLGVTYKFKGCYPGGSYTNDANDLGYLGLDMGVKSSQVGSIVNVAFRERFPQIICQYKQLSEKGLDYERVYMRVYIMGILKPEYIQYYCNREYLTDDAVLRKGSKGGFFQFDKLVPFTKESLSQYKSKVQINNYLATGFSELSINLVKKSCIYFEKLKGYEVLAKPMPILEGDKFKWHTINKDFRGFSVEDQEAFLELLSKRIVIGYGIAGYLHTMQDRYTGNKEFNIQYIDIDDIIRGSGQNGFSDSAQVSAEWVNRLFAWVDYLKKYNDLPKSRTEDYYDWHYRLCIAYMETIYKKLNKNKVA